MKVVCPVDVSEMLDVDIYLSLDMFQIFVLFYTFISIGVSSA